MGNFDEQPWGTSASVSNSTYVVYGPGGQPVEQINPDGSVLWLHHDQLGSIRLATTATSGTEAGRTTYNAYGTVASKTGTQPLLGYAGQYSDPETGYQYLRARYYDPTTTQFLTRDPIAATTGEPYSYASARPTHGVDPWGLTTTCPDGTVTQDWETCGPGGVESQGGESWGGNTGVAPGANEPYDGDSGGSGRYDVNGNLQPNGQPGSRNSSEGSGDDTGIEVQTDISNWLSTVDQACEFVVYMWMMALYEKTVPPGGPNCRIPTKDPLEFTASISIPW